MRQVRGSKATQGQGSGTPWVKELLHRCRRKEGREGGREIFEEGIMCGRFGE